MSEPTEIDWATAKAVIDNLGRTAKTEDVPMVVDLAVRFGAGRERQQVLELLDARMRLTDDHAVLRTLYELVTEISDGTHAVPISSNEGGGRN